ncbi:helix-turn-helix domain protein [Streptomyces albus]|nr:helix-turn-helix domain protein [Streptomyces albus]
MDENEVEGNGQEPDVQQEDSEWEVDQNDEFRVAVAMVGRLIKAFRESAGMRVAEFAAAVGYGPNQIYKIESGSRIPRSEFLTEADVVLRADDKIAMWVEDMEEARYPKKVQNLSKLEGRAVELGAYEVHNLHGLLQTPEYAQALYEMRRPAYSQRQIEQLLAERMARKSIFEKSSPPTLTFVQEEVTLRRPVGGKEVLHRQLRYLLEVAQLRHVDIQVMPTECDDHAGLSGHLQFLKFQNGTALGYDEGSRRMVSDPAALRVLDLRYGMIRAQALTPRKSMAFIEKLLGET